MNSDHLTWVEALNEERKLINQRRPAAKPVADDLVGLAFSGGGIRSATFGLGVLEALKELGLLKKFDYLSTVSGGGYIGAWLSANCKRAAEQKPVPVDWLDKSTCWRESVDYLRRYSNYLSPKLGFFSADTWSMGTVWLRNTMLVQLTVILAIAVVLLVPRFLFVAFHHWPEVGHWRWTTISLFITGAVGIAANQWRLNHDKVLFGRWFVGCAAALSCTAVAWWAGAHFSFDPFNKDQTDYQLAIPIAILLVLAGFCLQPTMAKLVYLKRPNEPQVNYGQMGVQLWVVVPMMAVGFLVAAIMWGQSQTGHLAQLANFGDFFKGAWRYWPFPLTVVFTSLMLFSFCSMRSLRGWQNIALAVLAPFPALLVLHALLCAIMALFHGWSMPLGGPEGRLMAYVWGPAMVLYSFTLTVLVLIGMLGRQSTEGVREWWSRFGAWLGIYGTAWMVINVAAAYAPKLGDFLLSANAWKSISLGWVATTLAGLFAGKSDTTSGKNTKSTLTTALDWVARIAPFFFVAGLLLAVSYILHFAIGVNSEQTLDRFVRDTPDGLPPETIVPTLAVFAVCLFTFLLLAWRVDINEFGLNAFYRSRLVRCYLGATRFRANERNPQRFTGFDDADDLKLSTLSYTPAGPLHIINCALNLGGSSDLALHTRHSAIFTLTPLHCGSRYLSRDKHENRILEMGYTPTGIFGGNEGQPTLGQAISVSGAAASPNMGYHTSPVVAFLLTLFDVRLGWWFPNPSQSGINSSSPGFSLRYLLMELFGGADDKSKYLAISDGGHFENLAAYELVKRQCKVIVISDAECDPDLRFEGLGTLIRVCDVDFDAKIKIDVRPLTPKGEPAWSGSRFAVGTIEYPDGSRGALIYLKASMTGDESTSVLQYKSTHPTFPHESTGNQFYKEDQFECYRNLGCDVATKAFESMRNETDFVSAAFKLAGNVAGQTSAGAGR
jgi:hypothetical protein